MIGKTLDKVIDLYRIKLDWELRKFSLKKLFNERKKDAMNATLKLQAPPPQNGRPVLKLENFRKVYTMPSKAWFWTERIILVLAIALYPVAIWVMSR